MPVEICYPDGHFTELMRLHNWPPMFVPQLVHDEAAQRR